MSREEDLRGLVKTVAATAVAFGCAQGIAAAAVGDEEKALSKAVVDEAERQLRQALLALYDALGLAG